MMFGFVILLVMFSSWAAVSTWLVLKHNRVIRTVERIAEDVAAEREITADLLRITKGYAEIVDGYHKAMLQAAIRAKVEAEKTHQEAVQTREKVEQVRQDVKDVKAAVGEAGASGVRPALPPGG